MRWLALAAAVIALVAILLLGRDDKPSSSATTTTSVAEEESSASSKAVARQTVTTTTTSTAEPPAPAPVVDDARHAQRNERVSNAFELLRYPPTSQRLTAEMRDVIHPNHRYETPTALSSSLTYELTADVYSVVGAASLHPHLEVSQPYEITRSVLTTSAQSIAVPFDTITPSTIPELSGYRGLARLEIDFTAQNQPIHASLDFRIAGTVPATFAGVTGDRLSSEGLEVTVGIDVQEAGRYFIQGLLFDASDNPIGYAVARPTLTPGHTTVPLTYFGLMFHDANANGPYVFKTLTGVRLPNGQEPDRAEMETWEGPYRTAAYRLSDFSNQEYESPAKDAKIAALNALANGAGKRQGAEQQ